MSEDLDRLTGRLTESGLVSSKQLESLCQDLPSESPPTAEQLRSILLQHQMVTEYQAEVVFSERPDPLLVGDYTILDRLGQGGMGIVFKATHRRMKRTVAVFPAGTLTWAASIPVLPFPALSAG